MDNGLFMLIIYSSNTQEKQSKIHYNKKQDGSECVFFNSSVYNLQMNSRIKTQKNEENEQNCLNPLNIHQLIFEQRIFLPLLEPDSQQPRVHPLIFKLMRVKNMAKMVVYILSESNLYFLYKIEIMHQILMDLNNRYQLSLKKLSDFIQFFKLSLQDIQSQQKFGIVQTRKNHNNPTILFTLKKIVGGKNHIVMELKGEQQTQDLIIEHVAYMYGHIQDRIKQKQIRINRLKELVRLKNPYLLKNFKQI